MKHKITLLFLFSVVLLFGQHKFLEYPKFNEADLKKEKSNLQAEAPAEVLYSSVSNTINSSYGELEFTVFKRIKIYNKEKAGDYLNVEIYLHENNSSDREIVTSLNAASYTLEDGKVVTTKVEKDSKFKSKENKNLTIQKFAFENVKNGTVLEYKYTVLSPFIHELPKIYFEESIPIVYEEYILDAPKPYGFNINFQGSLIPKHKDVGPKNLYATEYNSWRLGFENIKPFKIEKFMKNANNYRSSIRPEVNSTFFGNEMKNYALSWNDVSKKLKEYEDFGGQLGKKSFAKNLLTPEITNEVNSLKKAEEVLKFIQKNYTWNQNMGIFTKDGVKNLTNTKIGNAAELNLLMVMMMREAGLDANPIILKTVGRGLLNISYPSITDPNYVIAGLKINDIFYVFDATSKLTVANVLLPRAYNYNGVMVSDNKADVLEINNSELSSTFLTIDAKLNDDASFSGNFKDRDTKIFSILNHEKYNENKDSYQKEYKERYTFPFTNIKTGLVNDKDFETSFDFNADSFVDGIGNKLVFNPLLFLYRQNHDFNETEERKYPIEFLSPYETIKKVSITIPENFVFENVPTSKKFRTEDNEIVYTYFVTQRDKKITIETTVKVASSFYSKEYYPAFKHIFDNITKLEGQVITAVKK